MTKAAALIARHPIWQGARDATVRRLAASARVVELAAGQVAVREGEPAHALFLLSEGAARTYYPAKKDRPQLTVKLLRAPAAFGDVACLVQGHYTATVEAVVAARFVAIAKAAYVEALHDEPSACFRQYHDLAERFAGAVQMEKAAYAAGLAERIVALLAAYAAQFGVPVEDGTLIDCNLAQEDLADQTGATRRTVVRTLALLYERGVLSRRGRRFVVRDVDELVRALGTDVPVLAHASRAP